MAYGDATLQNPPVPWEEFEYMEYLYRLEDLLKERGGAFMRACHPDAHRDADAEWRRLDKELEQTALEFAAYAARLRLRAT